MFFADTGTKIIGNTRGKRNINRLRIFIFVFNKKIFNFFFLANFFKNFKQARSFFRREKNRAFFYNPGFIISNLF